jgi:hypothetical protein
VGHSLIADLFLTMFYAYFAAGIVIGFTLPQSGPL